MIDRASLVPPPPGPTTIFKARAWREQIRRRQLACLFLFTFLAGAALAGQMAPTSIPLAYEIIMALCLAIGVAAFAMNLGRSPSEYVQAGLWATQPVVNRLRHDLFLLDLDHHGAHFTALLDQTLMSQDGKLTHQQHDRFRELANEWFPA